MPPGHDLLFTIGPPATVSAVRGTAGIPIIAGLVLRDDALRKAKNATGVVLDFPPETPLKALRRFLPDAVVHNPKAAKIILLFSYRHRIPFIGPSESWVKEGAFYALDRDYRDMGAQCGEMADRKSTR